MNKLHQFETTGFRLLCLILWGITFGSVCLFVCRFYEGLASFGGIGVFVFFLTIAIAFRLIDRLWELAPMNRRHHDNT